MSEQNGKVADCWSEAEVTYHRKKIERNSSNATEISEGQRVLVYLQY